MSKQEKADFIILHKDIVRYCPFCAGLINGAVHENWKCIECGLTFIYGDKVKILREG